MRRLIVTVISTLDGYAAGEGGDVFAMPIDLGFDHYNLSRMREAETLLFGAQTFRAARAYWPQPANNSEAPEVERQISRLHNTLRKVVISDTLKPEDTTLGNQHRGGSSHGNPRPDCRAQGRKRW